ncbi:hypothetical protein D3C79_578250 [compost metagenome]
MRHGLGQCFGGVAGIAQHSFLPGIELQQQGLEQAVVSSGQWQRVCARIQRLIPLGRSKHGAYLAGRLRSGRRSHFTRQRVTAQLDAHSSPRCALGDHAQCQLLGITIDCCGLKQARTSAVQARIAHVPARLLGQGQRHTLVREHMLHLVLGRMFDDLTRTHYRQAGKVPAKQGFGFAGHGLLSLQLPLEGLPVQLWPLSVQLLPLHRIVQARRRLCLFHMQTAQLVLVEPRCPHHRVYGLLIEVPPARVEVLKQLSAGVPFLGRLQFMLPASALVALEQRRISIGTHGMADATLLRLSFQVGQMAGQGCTHILCTLQTDQLTDCSSVSDGIAWQPGVTQLQCMFIRVDRH